jgi:hypothetical protein
VETACVHVGGCKKEQRTLAVCTKACMGKQCQQHTMFLLVEVVLLDQEQASAQIMAQHDLLQLMPAVAWAQQHRCGMDMACLVGAYLALAYTVSKHA